MSNPSRISIKGILLGFLTDLAGSMTVGLIFGIAVGGVAMAIASSQGGRLQNHMELVHQISTSPFVLLTGGLIGLCCTGLGGYVAGRIGRQAPLLNAALLGVLSEGLTYFLSSRDAPLWFTVFGYAGVFPVALLGGWLASRRAAAAEPPPLPFS